MVERRGHHLESEPVEDRPHLISEGFAARRAQVPRSPLFILTIGNIGERLELLIRWGRLGGSAGKSLDGSGGFSVSGFGEDGVGSVDLVTTGALDLTLKRSRHRRGWSVRPRTGRLYD